MVIALFAAAEVGTLSVCFVAGAAVLKAPCYRAFAGFMGSHRIWIGERLLNDNLGLREYQARFPR